MIALSLAVLALGLQDPVAATPATTAAETAELFPNVEKPELQAGDEGALLVGCIAQLTGELTDCRVLSENPTDSGLTKVAIEAATRGRLPPNVTAAFTTARPVRFVMRFRIEDNPEQPAAR